MASIDELLLLINNKSDYATIVKYLRQYNRDLFRSTNTFLRDQSFQSSTAHMREVLFAPKQPSVLKKDEYLGIVLKVEILKTIKQVYKIYVHVPKDDIDDIPEADIFNTLVDGGQLKLKDYEYLVFYPVSNSVIASSVPSPKNIVRVQPADNFFNVEFTNPLDNKYLGLLDNASVVSVPPSTDGPQIPSVNATQALQGINVPPTGKSVQQNGALKRFSRVSTDVLLYSFNKLKALLPELSNEQISGIIGNFIIESGMDATIINNIGAYGIAQWLNPRKRKLLQTANEQNKDVFNLDFQLEFVAYESKLTPKPPKYDFGELAALRDLKTKITPEEAAISWMQKWERPSPSEQAESGPKRAAAAREMYNLFISPTTAAQSASTVPVAKTNNTSQTKGGAAGSNPVSYPKLKLVTFDADLAFGVRKDSKLGSKQIKVREDIFGDLENIKKILNKYNCSFTLNSQEINLNNNQISLLAKVGLEVKLNINSALTNFMNPEIDDFLVGPDYNFPIGDGFKLIVYANVNKNINFINEKYLPETKLLDIYNTRNTYLKNKPEIIKICKPVLNLTKIFEDFGFIQKTPQNQFFINSNSQTSNWNIFQKTSKIYKGMSYKELLKTVYMEDASSIWQEQDIFWNGSNFI